MRTLSGRSVIVKEEYEGTYDLGIPEIRSKLRDILEMLKTKQVVILLDEWQAKITLDCQAEFAGIIKTMLFWHRISRRKNSRVSTRLSI